jgi:putative membrane protein
MEIAVAEEKERFLILVVDRDGDLVEKTRTRSPVYGRDEVIAAATKLAISDPEEADANAIFAAVREFDRLTKQEVECEVAVVCGMNESGFTADRKIKTELEFLLKREEYSSIIFVSDGAEDEQVIPIIQSLKPITSVVRIVVKHSRTVEETYLVLGRYLRMLIFDPRYSKWAVGVPGVMFLLAGILVLLGRAYEAGLTILLILGSAFLVRGFNIDRFVGTMLHQRPFGYVRLFSILASILIFLVGLSSGFSFMISQAGELVASVNSSPSLFLVYGTILIGFFLKGSLPLIWAGFSIYLIGSLLIHLIRGSIRAWRNAVMIVILGLLYFPMDIFSTFLIGGQRSSSILLVSYVLVGLAVIFGVATVLYKHFRQSTLKE